MSLFETKGNEIIAEDSIAAVAFFSLQDRLLAVAQHVHDATVEGSVSVKEVHNLRMATRRALAAMRIYEELLPAKRTEALKLILKSLLRTAGQTRDLDVLARHCRKAKFHDSRRLVKEICKLRVRKQRLLSKLCSHQCKKDRLTRRVDHVLGRRDVADRSTELFGTWAKSRWFEIVQDFSKMSSVEGSNLELLHQFRICGKGLRYAMELLESTFNQELLPLAYATVTELQERLGHINDQCVAIDLFRQWKRECLALTRTCRLKAPMRVASRKLDQAIAEFKSWWTPTVRSELLRSLAQLAETSER